MLTNKTVLAICCAVLIGIGGCSRQQSDWQKTRESNTTDAYEQFLKKYPSGEFTAQAQARLKEMYEERDWQKARDADTPEAYQAFLKQYPEGKWTEEARIRVENFTLAQTPAGNGAPPSGPAMTGPAMTGPAMTGPAMKGPAPPGPAMTGPAMTGPAMKSASPNGPAASGEAEDESESAAPPPKTSAKTSSATSAKSGRSASSSSGSGESGKFAVQLGAFKSGHAAADKRWARLQKEYPKLLGDLTSKVSARKASGGTLYRLQAVGLTESHARRICKTLKSHSQACVIVRPVHGHKTSQH